MDGKRYSDNEFWIPEVYNLPTAQEAIAKLKELEPLDRIEALSDTTLLAIIEVQQLEAVGEISTENLVSSLLELVPHNDIHYIISQLRLFRTSLLHSLIRLGDKHSMKSILKPLTIEQRIEVLGAPDWRGNTLLHAAVFSSSESVMTCLLDSVICFDPTSNATSSSYFSAMYPLSDGTKSICIPALQQLLFTQNTSGSTFLYLATAYGSANLTCQIMSSLPALTLLDLLKIRNHQDQTCLHAAAQSRDYRALRVILKQLNFQVSGYREILLESNLKGNTFLHDATLCGSTYLIESVLELLPPEIVCTLTQMRNKSGRTVLHCAATNGERDEKVTVTSIYMLLKFITDHLSQSDLEAAVFVVDENGSTLLHKAAAKGSLSVVRDVITVLPSATAVRLALIRDKRNRIPANLAYGPKLDLLQRLTAHEQTTLTSVHIIACCIPTEDRGFSQECVSEETRGRLHSSYERTSAASADTRIDGRLPSALVVFFSCHGAARLKSGEELIEQSKESKHSFSWKSKMVSGHRCDGDETSDDSGPIDVPPFSDSLSSTNTDSESTLSYLRALSWSDGCTEVLYCIMKSTSLTDWILAADLYQSTHWLTAGRETYPDVSTCTLCHMAAAYSVLHQLMKLCSTEQSDKLSHSDSASPVLCGNRSMEPDIRTIRFLEGDTQLHQTCYNTVAHVMLSILKSVDSATRMRLLSVRNSVSQTPLHVLASPTNGICKAGSIIYDVLDLLTTAQKMKVLKATDMCGRTVLHSAMVDEKSPGNFLQKFKSGVTDYKELLGLPNSDGSTILHMLAEFDSSNQLSALLTDLDTPLLTRLMMTRDKRNQTPLLRAARNKRSHDLLLSLIGILVKDSEDALLSVDNDGCCFLHYVCESEKIADTVFTCLPHPILTKLLKVRNRRNRTILHVAAANKLSGHQAMKALLHFIQQNSNPDWEALLLSADDQGSTLMHQAAQFGSESVIRDLVTQLPRHIAERLASTKDAEGRIPAELTQPYSLQRDLIQQAGAYPTDFYPLESAPKVLIFYTTKNRRSDDGTEDAEEERKCVEQFVQERNFRYDVRRDPTSSEVYSSITSALSDDNLSALIVFVMTHGQNGLISVREGGGEDFMMVEDIITHMGRVDRVKPKALIVQACQTNQPNQQTSSAAADESRRDPVAGGCVVKRSVVLKRPDFLLFMAAATGSWALRNLMIPSLVESLRELRPSDCITHAFISTIAKIRRTEPDQIPLLQSTLQRRLCIGKEFPPIRDTELGYGETAMESYAQAHM